MKKIKEFDSKKLGFIGMILTIMGFLVSLVSGKVSEAKQDAVISEKVAKAVADATANQTENV